MKKLSVLFLAIFLTAGLFSSQSVFGQPAMPEYQNNGPSADSQYSPLYNTKTVEALLGTVVAVDKSTPRGRGRYYGVHIVLKTDKETIIVHLGPAWYLDAHGPTIRTGDKIEVVGSRVTIDNKPVVLAAEIRKGNQFLQLRTTGGIPLWGGGRMRPRF